MPFIKAMNLPVDPLIERVLKEIKKSINGRFMQSLGGKSKLEEVIEALENIITDLPMIKDSVEPCFPPIYKIFEFYRSEYLDRIENTIRPFIPKSDSDADSDPGILVVLASWLENYGVLLKKLGIEQSDAKIQNMEMVFL